MLINGQFAFAATTLKVAFGADKPPFVITSVKPAQGLEIDIFREAMAQSGYQLEMEFLPFHQLNRALQTFPDLDVAAGVGSEFFSELHYVENFTYYENVAVSKQAAALDIHSIEDLKRYSVVAWQGASQVDSPLGSKFHQLFAPALKKPLKSRYQELNQTSQTAMFWLGRTDVIIIDKTIFAWSRQTQREQFNTAEPVILHDLFAGRQYTQVAFRDKAIAEIFARGLSQLKETGRYQQLYQDYRQLPVH